MKITRVYKVGNNCNPNETEALIRFSLNVKKGYKKPKLKTIKKRRLRVGCLYSTRTRIVRLDEQGKEELLFD